jgi:Zn-dependent oligopeptidase
MALKGKLEAAAEVQQRMEGVIEQQKIVLEKQQEDVRKMQELNKEISTKFSESQLEVSQLNQKFSNRNLARSSLKNPNETEMRVNRGTKDALRCNELITGAPLTTEEKSGKVKNGICDELIRALVVKEKP